MNSVLFAIGFNTLEYYRQDSTNFFSSLSSLDKESVSSKGISDILVITSARIQKLKIFLQEMGKLESLMLPSVYNDLVGRIKYDIGQAESFLSLGNDYLNSPTEEELNAFINQSSVIVSERDGFYSNFKSARNQIEIVIIAKYNEGTMSLNDLKAVCASLDKKSTEYERMSNYIMDEERRIKVTSLNSSNDAKLAVTGDVKTEDKDVIDIPVTSVSSANVDNSSNNSDIEQALEPVKEKETLVSKIAKVAYTENGNIIKDVQNLTIEDQLEMVKSELATYEGKDRLSLSESIAFHKLATKMYELEKYQQSLDIQKQGMFENSRDNKINIDLQKIDTYNKQINESLLTEEQLKSSITKFFNARYREGLQIKIDRLNVNAMALQNKQKKCALKRYDKKMSKLKLVSDVMGFFKGIKAYANQKVEDFITLKNKTVKGVQNLSDDIRFISTKNADLARLKNKVGMMLDQPIALNGNQVVVGMAK